MFLLNRLFVVVRLSIRGYWRLCLGFRNVLYLLLGGRGIEGESWTLLVYRLLKKGMLALEVAMLLLGVHLV